MKKRIYLIHWNATEAVERAALLRRAGFEVEYGMPNAAGIRALKENRPDAFLIDLSRLPSQGRDVALVIRQGKTTRNAPIVFAGGLPEKLQTVKKHLPDAVYSSWDTIPQAIRSAIAKPLSNPVVPRTSLDAYSGAPLPKKLGVKTDSRIMLIDAPTGLKSLIGPLPDGAKYISKRPNEGGLIIWFVKLETHLRSEIDTVSNLLADRGGIWICWPKKTSGVKSDLSEKMVRHIGLTSGLVDYKVCSIDDTWSGLKFARRKGNLK